MVVKVQRPGIEETVSVDLEILMHLAGLAERHIHELSLYRPPRIVEEFARVIEREMDFLLEASHMERFARQFMGNTSVYVPAVFSRFTTSRVLTMEHMEGIKYSDTERLDAEGHDRKQIASRGADLVLDQIFKFGFFHADPHPGNVFILPADVICYLDFGMMGTVDRSYEGGLHRNSDRICQPRRNPDRSGAFESSGMGGRTRPAIPGKGSGRFHGDAPLQAVEGIEG